MDTTPAFELSAEQRDLRRDIRDFVAEEIDTLDFDEWEWREDPRDRIPWHVIEAADDWGLQDLTVPEEYGGRDASPLTLAVAAEEISAGDLGTAVNVNQMWKICRLIDHLAEPSVRERFFEEFLDDPRHMVSICLTEPAHGTDYQVDHDRMQFDTVAREEGDEWVIDGEKVYISCAPEAKTLLVYAQTDPDASAQGGTTAFFVPRDTDGLAITHVWEKVAGRLSNNGTVEFDDVRVPDEYVLGEVNEAKRRTAEVLKEGHVESGGIALGTARRAFQEAYAYANERVQGGTEIVNHQALGHDFAGMATDLQAARSLVWTAARAIEEQGDAYDPMFGQMAKLFAGRTAADVGERALEKFGAQGIMFENDRPMQKLLRDSKVYLHSDGTLNAHREVIAGILQDRYN